MTEDVNNIPESWLSALDGSDASGWLTAFTKAPEKAVEALLWDTFYFGPLNVTERGQLLTGWLGLLGNRDSFAERLDAELTRWVEKNWGNFDRRAETLISAWSCLCSVVEFSAKLYADSHLKKCATLLRAGFTERQSFLGSFSIAPAADPLGLYLAVLAEFQGEDRSLAAFWHQMCLLPDSVPFYHARYAMLGLRRLKAINPVEDGTLRAEIVMGLLHLARNFDRLVRERGLNEAIAEDTFFRVAAQTAAAYPNSPLWLEHGKAEFDKLPDKAQEWVSRAVRPFKEVKEHGERQSAPRQQQQQQQQSSKFLTWNPSWRSRREELLEKLRRGKIDCIPQVLSLLDEERFYAESISDSSYFVRTLCRFADKAVHFSPKIALVWAREARERAPYDPFTWSTLRTILVNQKELDEALRYAWVAWKRFPQNDVIRNDLGATLRAALRYDEAEAIYRQTMEHFPGDPVARNGLADVLRRVKRYDEAIAIYRETIKRFPDNITESIIARNGLAGTLRKLRRWREAETEYRRSIDAGLASSKASVYLATTFVNLSTILLRKGEASRAEALSYVAKALDLNPHHKHARQLKQQLTPESDVNLRELADEWDQIADALLEASASAQMVEDVESLSSQPETVAEPQYDQSQTPIPPPTEEEPVEAAPVKAEPVEAERIAEPLKEAHVKTESTKAAPFKTKRVETAPTKTESIAEPVKAEQPVKTEPGKAEPVDTKPIEEPIKAEPMVAEAKEPESRLRLSPYDPIRVAALVAEAYFYRTWVRDAEPKAKASRRRKAAALLATAEQMAPQDAQVLAEKIALSVDEGDVSIAYENLTAQLRSHSGATELLVLKARMDRDKAHREGRVWNESNLGELCAFPQRLRALNSSLMPLFHFQRGLAALALLDGEARLNAAAKSFTRFREVLSHRAAEERKDRKEVNNRAVLNFHEWLQIQVDNRVFPGTIEPETKNVHASDIHSLEAAWGKRPFIIEEIENVFADRLAFGTM